MRRTFVAGIVLIALLLVTLLYLRRTKRPALESADPSAETTDVEAPQAVRVPARAKPADFVANVEATNEVPGRSLIVHVVTKGTQAPIDGAAVRASTHARPHPVNAGPEDRMTLTDRLGVARVPLPESDPERLQLWASRDGFAGWISIWEKSKGEIIPADHTIVLEPATLIGGSVVDGDSKPITGADVRLNRVWRGNETIDRGNQRMEIRSQSAKTDATGRWTANSVPEEYLKNIRITVTHPEFAQASVMVDETIIPDLRAQSWLVKMQEGARVFGFIGTTNGDAVVGADVSYGMQYSADRKITKSDAAGRYELKNLVPGNYARDQIVTVLAKEFMVTNQSLTMTNASGELNFTLQPGAVIRGRVQNAAGEPLQGVRVSRERASPINDDGIVWSTETDADGRFEWDSAPFTPQNFYFGLSGYTQLRGRRLEPSETEHVITLNKTRSVKGTVRDILTKDDVPVFFVMPAAGTVQQLSSWSSSSEREFKNGKFELEITEERTTVVRIRAKGYLTEIFQIPAAENGTTDALIQPSKTLEGIVLDASGNPVPKADVAAVPDRPRQNVTLGKGRFISNQSDADKTVTDDHGRFKLDLSTDAHFVIAAHPNGGFTRMNIGDFESQREVRLQSWGRIDGRTLLAGRPAPGQEVVLSDVDSVRLEYQSYRTKSDAIGNFSFDFVPPVKLALSRLEPTGSGSSTYRDRTNLTVTPGSPTRIDYWISKTNEISQRKD